MCRINKTYCLTIEAVSYIPKVRKAMEKQYKKEFSNSEMISEMIRLFYKHFYGDANG